jgi:hypothetical protein
VEKRGFGAACLGTLAHGGRKEAWSFNLLCVERLLVGGHTLGERAQASRH